MVELLKKAGQNVLFKKIIADDKAMISDAVQKAINMPELDVLIFSGGTGITPQMLRLKRFRRFLRRLCLASASFSGE